MAGSTSKSPNLAAIALFVVGGLLVLELYRVSQPEAQAETTPAAATAEAQPLAAK